MDVRRMPPVALAVFLLGSVPAYAFLGARKPTAPRDEKTVFITPEHAEAIYEHLVEDHWFPKTGLFISFLNSGEQKLTQQASTYEQAAIGLLALRMGDSRRASGIFHFFKEAWTQGPLQAGPRQGVLGLANFYNAEFGGEGIEKTIHVGPNAWAGLFAAHLARASGDPAALRWALDVASWIAHDIPHRDGGVAMGPVYGTDGTPWPKVFSVENNLSYYSLLSELLRAKTLTAADRTWISEEKNHIEEWLVNSAFDRNAYAMDRGINPMGRDRLRALDTVTWLVSALGPRELNARGIDPGRLMRMAEQNFEVTVHGLQGVDAADQTEANLTFLQPEDRWTSESTRPAQEAHRLIWFEGLGQYINALSALAAYASEQGLIERAQDYTLKAKTLTDQFDRAALKGYPHACAYAYATEGKFFHDGWRSPAEGPRGAASSLIAATWRCFAGLGYDPLAGGQIPGVTPIVVSVPEQTIHDARTRGILYGTSEDMTTQAWSDLNQGQLNPAILQAQATIQEWAPWAVQLEDRKAHKLGHLVDYTGLPQERKEIFGYWALNDVAAAYFILGKAWDQKGEYGLAAKAFQQIALHYSLAQVWDPGGWFWSPLQAVRNDYVLKDPKHYQGVIPDVIAETSNPGKQPD